METFDAAIIGGGSAGLAALKHLSDLGKQVVLIEAGPQVGSKNVSGGILYSKRPRNGKVYNVEDVYGVDFESSAPLERHVTKYILHATSGNKIFTIDLTSAHEYQTNFGYSVLLNKLNSWFATMASESAEKQGGGIVSGVHVRDVQWPDENKTIIRTDELDEFQVKAIIAADGVNSEIAYLTGAREKFAPHEVYQGVKIVIRLPEETIEERFEIDPSEGAAHLFAGDITLNHIGGGFLYTNRDTLSLGAVYHYESLISKPSEPSTLVNALIQNPFVSELIKDEVITFDIDRELSKEEQLRKRFTVTKLVKTFEELRYSSYSSSGRARLIDSGKYRNFEDMKSKLDSIRQELIEKHNTRFVTNYVELEYSTKLVPDGKRCRMKKPYHRNILFIGDAAGRGIFIGPRIEGLNVGMDDAVRAALAVSRSIDNNRFGEDYMGEYYTFLVDQSPYTRDMKEIDKEYLKIFLEATKSVPKEIVGSRYGLIFKIMSSGKLRGLAVGIANILGYDKILPLVESEETYVQVPVEIASKLGRNITSSYTPVPPSVEERVARLRYNDDQVSHIIVHEPESEFLRKLVVLCPTKCYYQEDKKVMLQHEGCIECGSCAKGTEWRHPRGEKGVIFAYG
ncbi:MAG: NAD(P)-binding protein [Thermoproteota archaeon]|nr:NAD(P)-binding protein [Thermoproteota archaeon]